MLPSRRTLAGLLLGLLAACSGPTEPVLDLAPDATRTGLAGSDGPYGAAHATFRAQARVTDVVEYEVAWPALADTSVDGQDHHVVLFIHGGLVESDRYRWLITHFASRGYVVVSPAHDLDLAIFESDNASIALDDARRRSEKTNDLLHRALGTQTIVTGHSLGGVVAAFRWVADPDLVGVAILASWAAEGTPVEEQEGRPSLSIIGSEDRGGEATQSAFENYQRFPDPSWFGVVQGMNHYDWADDPSDANLLSDGAATRPRDDTRRDAAHVLDTWLDAWLRDDPDSHAVLDEHAFPNVSEEP